MRYQELEDRIASLERLTRHLGIGQELTIGNLQVLNAIEAAQIEGIRFASHYSTLNAAYADIPSAGGTVVLDVQDFPQTAAITLVNNKHIIGYGGSTVWGEGANIKFTGTGVAFDLSDVAYHYNIQLKNFAIRDGGGNGTRAFDIFGFTTGCAMQSIRIKGFDIGVYMEDSFYQNLQHIHCTYQNEWSYYFKNCNAGPAINLVSANAAQDSTSAGGMYIGAGGATRGMSILGGTIEQCGKRHDSEQGNLSYTTENSDETFTDDGQDFSDWETTSGNAVYRIFVWNDDDTGAWGYLGAKVSATEIKVCTNLARTTPGWTGTDPSGKTPSTYYVINAVSTPALCIDGARAALIQGMYFEQNCGQDVYVYGASKGVKLDTLFAGQEVKTIQYPVSIDGTADGTIIEGGEIADGIEARAIRVGASVTSTKIIHGDFGVVSVVAGATDTMEIYDDAIKMHDGHLNLQDANVGPLTLSGLSGLCAYAYHSATQPITTATWTTLAFDSERFDTDTIHDTVTNNERLTCKTAGKYLIKAAPVQFAQNATGQRSGRVLLNGSTTIAEFMFDAAAATGFLAECSTIYSLAANDYVTVQVYQNSGGDLNIETITSFMMVKVA